MLSRVLLYARSPNNFNNFPASIWFLRGTSNHYVQHEFSLLALSPSITAASPLACLCPLKTCPPLTPRTPPLAQEHSPLTLCPCHYLCPCPGLWPLNAASHAAPPDFARRVPSGCEAPWIAQCSSASVLCNLHQIVSFDPLQHVAPWSAPGSEPGFYARS